jgi:hypothetical protein
MKHSVLILLLALVAGTASAQSYVTIIYDQGHLAIVNENGAVRLASEVTHNRMLSDIKDRIEDINVNLSSVVAAQRMILRALTEVDAALKSGRSITQIVRLVEDIGKESGKLISTARDQPWLLPFAEGAARQLQQRCVRLATDVSDFILKEGSNVLMDFEKRDFLLRKTILELQVIRSLAYGMHRSMWRAAIAGPLKLLNPYRDFINRDTRIATDILRNLKSLDR